ncbi:phytochromobilin:ferredoxin oxidoreductase chloroplastic [Phtheirospermum japonicum]|uniref:Phytochromobilin:ferredoxin oxidoreductase chloroplastic n=1 Tax=Phtheirospermum japonicum TaxID=374723 RepID=A0A830CSQ1_9LAMI|nr:phytochromobilin:ferredoxin oxidoreductase chloroplastic [Phtheirospermum japonicum]
MESCSYLSSSPKIISTLKKSPLNTRTTNPYNLSVLSSTKSCSIIASTMRPSIAEANSSFSYKKFVQFALEETGKHTQLLNSPLQENFSCLAAMDGKTELQMQSFESPKIRLLRSLSIEGSDGMQVLDFAIFPRAEFNLPIFCANFFSTAAINIVVLDLNPLHDVINQQDYKEKYYKHLIPLGLKYSELFPWGGKITAESMRFFSPIVIWAKFPPNQQKHHDLFSAFKDYLKSWLELMDQASEETDASQIMLNLESQHRYLTWRSEKVGSRPSTLEKVNWGDSFKEHETFGYVSKVLVEIHILDFDLVHRSNYSCCSDNDRPRFGALVKSMSEVRAFGNVDVIEKPDPNIYMESKNLMVILRAATFC